MNGPNLKYTGCVAKADVKIHRFQLAVFISEERYEK